MDSDIIFWVVLSFNIIKNLNIFEISSPALFYSFITKSTPGFKSPSQIPSKPKDLNGLDIVLSQDKYFIYYLHGSDAVPNFLDWWNRTPYTAKAREKDRTMN